MKKLKKYLVINSVFSGISGLALLLLSKELNDFFGISHAAVFPVTGAGLIVFSLFAGLVSAKRPGNKKLVAAITILDASWVLGSFVIVIFGLFDLSRHGYILISIVALWIAFLAYQQYKNNK